MPCLSDVQASNASYSPAYLPVAIFAGGTSGIGRGTAEALARHTNGDAHIILVGRNAAAAASILASFPKPVSSESGWKHEFVECDVSLVQNVNTTLSTLLPRLPRVNFLVLSCGVMIYGSDDRDETQEGLDRRMAVTYYARAAFMRGLLPALAAAHAQGEGASVLNVLAAGRGTSIDIENLGLKRGYTGQRVRGEIVTYMDLLHEELAARNPGLAFTHTYPGFVDTSLGRISSKAIGLDISEAGNIADAGEYTLHAVLSAAPGAQSRGKDSEEIHTPPVYGRGSSEESKAVFGHTEEVVNANV